MKERFVYLNGIPIQFIKMNNEWHYTTLHTIGRSNRGEDGTNNSAPGAAITADLFMNDFMPLNPSSDSGWRQLVPRVGSEVAGQFYDTQADQNSFVSSWQYGVMASSGDRWPCIYENVPQDWSYTFGGQDAVYEWHHGLQLTDVPRLISAYVCDSPPNASWSVDQGGITNCLITPHSTDDAARADGLQTMALALDFWNNEGEDFYNNSFEGGNLTFDGRQRSIILSAPGTLSKTAFGGGNSSNATMTMQIMICIISPNKILFSPSWTTLPWHNASSGQVEHDEYVGFQCFEWVKFKMWR